MTPEVTKTVLNKIILNVWIENGPILKYGPGIELAFRSNSYVLIENSPVCVVCVVWGLCCSTTRHWKIFLK
jgi:hypothetical protein